MLSQRQFLGVISGAVRQKSFKIIDSRGTPETIAEIDITLVPNPQPVDPVNPGSAEAVGWSVDVRHSNAPEITLFTKTFPTEVQAQDVMDDFALLAAEVEGLIKKEDFTTAAAKTEELERKFIANTAQAVITTKETAQ